jgi:hypothetical protein
MHALISPNEKAVSWDGTVLGQRVAEVVQETFQVAPPLFWVDCDDTIQPDRFYYLDGTFGPIPPPPPPPPAPEPPVTPAE